MAKGNESERYPELFATHCDRLERGGVDAQAIETERKQAEVAND